MATVGPGIRNSARSTEFKYLRLAPLVGKCFSCSLAGEAPYTTDTINLHQIE
jgi:hypothetical protein